MALPFRILLILVAAVLLLFAAIGVFILTLDLEDYRDDIVRSVRESTGLDLRLDGALDLSLWPSISLTVADAAADWEDASSEPLVTMRRMEFELPLMPLLTGAGLEIESVLVDGVALDLRVAANGDTNWAPAADGGDGNADADGTAADADPAGDGQVDLELALERLEVSDLGIRYRDARDATDIELSGLNLVLTGDVPDAIDAELGGRLDIKDGPRMAFRGDLRGDREARRIQIRSLEADMQLPDWASPLPIRISGEIRRDDSVITLDGIAIDIGELALLVDGTVTDIDSEPEIRLDLIADDFDLRALLTRSGEALDTSDPAALTRVSARLGLRGSSANLRIDPLALAVDDLDIAGTATVARGDRTRIDFALDAGRLNLLPYLPVAEETPEADAGGPLVSEDPLGLEALADVDMDGTLTASALILPGLETGEARIDIDARAGKMDTRISAASVLGGSIAMDLAVDVRGATPKLGLALDADDIDSGRLAPEAGFTGAVSLAGRLDATGASSAALARNARGRFDLSGAGGTVDVTRLRAALLPWAQLLGRPEKIAAWPDQMGYRSLTGTWALTDGTGAQQLNLAIDNMRIDASGGIALDTGVFDFRSGALFADATPRTFDVPRDLDGIRLPARCAGRLGEPGNPCGFDQQATGDLVRQVAAGKAGDAIRENLSEKLPEELRGPADALLRGLFGRPRQDTPPR